MMKLVALLIPLTLTLFLSACNTMEGVGKDVESAGDAIEDSAAKHKDY
ncbi:entericidin A/B family lipoprotein [Methylophaga sulfidovorans]